MRPALLPLFLAWIMPWSASLAAPPANDDFAAAQSVGPALPVVVGGTTAEATAEATEPDYTTEFETLAPLATAWYRWTPNANVSVDMRTEGDLDTVLGVFTGASLSTLTAVAVNDQTSLGTGSTSRVTFNAVAGTTYRIMVDAYTPDDQGPFVLTIRSVLRPPNDAFANATVVSGLNVSLLASNINATAEAGEASVLGDAPQASVWWRWSHTASTRIEMVATNDFFIPRLAVYTGTALPGTKVAEGVGRVRFQAVGGTTYRLSADGFGSEEGEFPLVIRAAPAKPANDDFANATALTGALPLTRAGTTAGASTQVSEPLHAGRSPWASVWYTWTAPANPGRMEIDTLGSAFDTSLAVYTGTTLAALVMRGENDDAAGGTQSRVRFTPTGGTVYRIAVDSPAREEGAVTLHVRSAPAAPANDNFSAATAVGPALPVAVSGGNAGASAEPEEPGATWTPASSVWYRWAAPVTGWVEVDTAGAAFDTVLAVYTGTVVTNLTLEASNDDDGTNTSSRLEFFARAGTTYRLSLDGAGGVEGAFTLRLHTAPPLDPFILSPAVQDDTLFLSFPARENRTYQLLSGPSPGALTPASDILTAPGSPVFFTLPVETSNEYFRVQAVDPP